MNILSLTKKFHNFWSSEFIGKIQIGLKEALFIHLKFITCCKNP